MLEKLNREAIKGLLKKGANLVGNTLTATLSSLLFAAMILFIGAKAPEIHGLLIRKAVGPKVYTVKYTSRGGGGTGFAIKGASGASYIVTNDHVCGLSKDKRTMLVMDDAGRSIRRNIIAQSEQTDLCLLEGIPGVEGLQLGSEPSIGQIVAAVGHPSLRPTTLTRGEIIGSEDLEIVSGMIGEEHGESFGITVLTKEECSLYKNRIRRVNTIFGEMLLCTVVTEQAYMSNVLIQPGSSGSPVVNFWGNVVAVVFAGDQYGWGSFVSFRDLQNFLSMY